MGVLKPEVSSPEKDAYARQNDYWLRALHRREVFSEIVTGLAIGAGLGAAFLSMTFGAVWFFLQVGG